MMEGPILATELMLEREGLTLDDIDLFEIHEAYATVVCAWRSVHPVEPERLNADGGAIAAGHPFGASGARQIAHLVHALRARGGGTGLQAMCCGGGSGPARRGRALTGGGQLWPCSSRSARDVRFGQRAARRRRRPRSSWSTVDMGVAMASARTGVAVAAAASGCPTQA